MADTAFDTGGDLFLRARSSVLRPRGTAMLFEAMLNGEEERGETGTVVGICGEFPEWGREPSDEEREGITGMNCCCCARGLGTRTASSPGPDGRTSQWSSLDGLVMGRVSRRGCGGGVAKTPWCAIIASCRRNQTRHARECEGTFIVNDGRRSVHVPSKRSHLCGL